MTDECVVIIIRLDQSSSDKQVALCARNSRQKICTWLRGRKRHCIAKVDASSAVLMSFFYRPYKLSVSAPDHCKRLLLSVWHILLFSFCLWLVSNISLNFKRISRLFRTVSYLSKNIYYTKRLTN